jgi:hypothetical protein
MDGFGLSEQPMGQGIAPVRSTVLHKSQIGDVVAGCKFLSRNGVVGLLLTIFATWQESTMERSCEFACPS